MTTIREYIESGTCSTGGVRVLNDQILSSLLLVVPDRLVSCAGEVEIEGASTIPYLQPAAKTALAAAVAEKGRKPKLLHAYRTVAQQYLLYDWFRRGRCDIPLAAPPGGSPHEMGIAIDISNNAQWRAVLANHNWRWRGSADPGHFTYIGSGINTGIRKESITAFQRLWNRNNPNRPIQEDGVYGDKETGASLLDTPISGW